MTNGEREERGMMLIDEEDPRPTVPVTVLHGLGRLPFDAPAALAGVLAAGLVATLTDDGAAVVVWSEDTTRIGAALPRDMFPLGVASARTALLGPRVAS